MNIIESIPQQGGVDCDDIPTLPNNDGGGTSETTNKKKRNKKLPLTKHEALTLFWQKGIYVDEATGELRTSTNHKICDKWDLYGYNRHFTFVSIYSCHCHLCVVSSFNLISLSHVLSIYHRHATRSMKRNVWTRPNSDGLRSRRMLSFECILKLKKLLCSTRNAN